MSLDNLFMDNMESEQQLLDDQCHPKKQPQDQTQDEWLADYNKRDEGED